MPGNKLSNDNDNEPIKKPIPIEYIIEVFGARCGLGPDTKGKPNVIIIDISAAM